MSSSKAKKRSKETKTSRKAEETKPFQNQEAEKREKVKVVSESLVKR